MCILGSRRLVEAPSISARMLKLPDVGFLARALLDLKNRILGHNRELMNIGTAPGGRLWVSSSAAAGGGVGGSCRHRDSAVGMLVLPPPPPEEHLALRILSMLGRCGHGPVADAVAEALAQLKDIMVEREGPPRTALQTAYAAMVAGLSTRSDSAGPPGGSSEEPNL